MFEAASRGRLGVEPAQKSARVRVHFGTAKSERDWLYHGNSVPQPAPARRNRVTFLAAALLLLQDQGDEPFSEQAAKRGFDGTLVGELVFF